MTTISDDDLALIRKEFAYARGTFHVIPGNRYWDGLVDGWEMGIEAAFRVIGIDIHEGEPTHTEES